MPDMCGHYTPEKYIVEMAKSRTELAMLDMCGAVKPKPKPSKFIALEPEILGAPIRAANFCAPLDQPQQWDIYQTITLRIPNRR